MPVKLLVTSALVAWVASGAAGASQPARAPLVTSVFCAHGGVGIWPNDQVRPYFAEAVVDVDLPSAGSALIGVTAFDLLEEATGRVVASLVGLEHIVQLPITPPSAQFATYLNPPGALLVGPLAPGTARLRIRVRLNHGSPDSVTRYRMTLSGLGAPVLVMGTVNGTWPT